MPGSPFVGFVLFLTQNRLSSSDVLFETYIRESVQGLEVGPGRFEPGELHQVGVLAEVAETAQVEPRVAGRRERDLRAALAQHDPAEQIGRAHV